jgi:tripartite-type tricarboxylate transporter receptor subunit TctC
MCVELMKRAAGIDLVHVPYKGAAPAIQAVLAGQVSMYCSPAFQALPHIKSGKLRALGTTGTKRSPTMPEVTTMSEQGLPEVLTSTWYAAFAPSNTPAPILNKIRDALKRTFDDAQIRQRLVDVALDPIWLDETALAAAVGADIAKWTELAKKAGIRTE